MPPSLLATASIRSRLSRLSQRILTSRVYDVAIETPLDEARTQSILLNNRILLKREDLQVRLPHLMHQNRSCDANLCLQPVFSFKIRGAYNKISHLTDAERAAGIVCCSAGNHAQGVALAAKMLEIDAKIVMPLVAPQIKVDSVRRFGGEYGHVILHGTTYDEAAAEATRLQMEEGRTMIAPFDDPLVIAGQGTIGVEIVKQMTGQPLEAIFCCVGGGGLLAGVAAFVKRVRPEVKVFGVEAADAASMTRSLECGRRVPLEHVGLFADGAAVKMVGAETFRVCQESCDGMITVTTDEICAAIKSAFNDTRTVMEPAGALAVAGCQKYIQESGIEGANFVAITSGANMDFDRLRFVSGRADMLEALISVVIPEEPGSFLKLYSSIYPRDVTEFSYRYSGTGDANIIMSYKTQDAEERALVQRTLAERGFTVADLSDNEMAKVCLIACFLLAYSPDQPARAVSILSSLPAPPFPPRSTLDSDPRQTHGRWPCLQPHR